MIKRIAFPIYFLLLSTLLSITKTSAQLIPVSDSNIPCEKVFLVDGGIAIGTNYYGHKLHDLVTFNPEDGEIMKVDTGYVIKSLNSHDKYYFYLNDINDFEVKIFSYSSNGLNELLQFPKNDYREHYFLENIEDLNLTIGSSADGFFHFDNGQIQASVNLGSPLIKARNFNGNLMAITKSNYFLLSSTDFSIIDSASFPNGWISFNGASLNNRILLSDQIEFGADYRKMVIYDIINSSITPVINAHNNSDSIFSGPIPQGIFNNQFILAGFSQTRNISNSAIENISVSGILDPASGIYTELSISPKTYQGRVNPQLYYSLNGPILFGKLALEGVEPYHISNNKLEVLKDIYRGFGGGVTHSPYWANHPVNENDFPSFHVYEQNGILLFSGKTAGNGHQLWRSDGTREGTYSISNLYKDKKGFEYAFYSGFRNKTYVTISIDSFEALTNRLVYYTKLFELGPNNSRIMDTLISEEQWEASYTSNPEWPSGIVYQTNWHPEIGIADDGSTAFLIGKMYRWTDYISINHNWVLPQYRDEIDRADYAIQIVDRSGSLKSSTILKSNESQLSFLARNNSNGHVYILTTVDDNEVSIDDSVLAKKSKGHYLIELDKDGKYIHSKFIESGGNRAFRVSQMEYRNGNVYIFGRAEDDLDMGFHEPIEASSTYKKAVVLKYDSDLNPVWLGADNDWYQLFAGGMDVMHVSDDAIFISYAGTSFNVRSSCSYSDWTSYVAKIDRESGEMLWKQSIYSDDVFRITSISSYKNDFLWLGGYTRGNLEIGHKNYLKAENYIECGYNSFTVSLDQNTGNPLFLESLDRGRIKFIQDMNIRNDTIYSLSLILEKENYFLPNFGNRARYSLQIDRMTPRGEFLDSAVWLCALSNWDGIRDVLRYHKFSFDFHPEGGIILAAENFVSGEIEPFLAPLPEKSRGLNSWLIQRKPIPQFKKSPENLTDITEDSPIIIFPNPSFENSFQIRLDKSERGLYDRVAFYNAQGRFCAHEDMELFFDSYYVGIPGKLQNGLYFIHLLGEGERKTGKLVIDR